MSCGLTLQQNLQALSLTPALSQRERAGVGEKAHEAPRCSDSLWLSSAALTRRLLEVNGAVTSVAAYRFAPPAPRKTFRASARLWTPSLP